MLCAVIGLARAGFWVTARLRQRREHAALTARLAVLPSGDIPAGVIELVAAGKKIQAVKRYGELTGTGLQEASAVVNRL